MWLWNKNSYEGACRAWVCFPIIFTLYPPKESSLKNSRRGPFGLSASLLPWVIKNFFSHPRRTYQKIGLYCADGRADGRAGVFSFCWISFRDLNIFSLFVRNFVDWRGGKIFLWKKNRDVTFYWKKIKFRFLSPPIKKIKRNFHLDFLYKISFSPPTTFRSPLGSRASHYNEARSAELLDSFRIPRCSKAVLVVTSDTSAFS